MLALKTDDVNGTSMSSRPANDERLQPGGKEMGFEFRVVEDSYHILA